MSVTVGPFSFEFLPDGDDPGTGCVRFWTASGYLTQTPPGVSRVEFEAFVAACDE